MTSRVPMDRRDRSTSAALESRFYKLNGDMLGACGFDGVFRHVNTAWERVLGWSEEEMCSRPFIELVHPDDVNGTLAIAGRLAEGSSVVHFRNRYHTKTDDWRWLDWTSVGVPQDEMIYASARDVSGQVALEQALTSQADELATARMLLEEAQAIAGVGSWEWRPGHDRSTWSAEQFRLHGLAPGLGAPGPAEFLACVHEEDRERIKEEMRSAVASVTAFGGEYRVVHPDGDVRTIEVRSTRSQDPDGEVYLAGTSQDVTERRRADQALRGSEQLHRAITTNLPDSEVLVFADDLRFVKATGANLAKHGHSDDQLVGRPVSAFLPMEGHAQLHDNLLAALSGQTCQYDYGSADDGRQYVLRTGPLRDGGGDISGGILVSYDVTERRQAERLLRESEAQLAEAQEIARLGSWEWDLARDEVSWSHALERLYDLESESFPEDFKGYLALTHPEDRERVESTVRGALDRREPFQVDHRFLRADGELRWLHSRGELVIRDGEPIKMVGTAQDVTEAKRADAERLASEQLLRSAFDDAMIGMCLTSPEGRLVRVNRTLCEMLGRTDEELVGVNFREIAHPEDVHLDDARLEQLLSGAISGLHLEKRYLHSSGDVVWVELSTSLVRDEDGRPLYLSTQMQDIRERKAAEAERADAHAEAVNASRMKSEFLANMSHEIRTPMNGVIGMTELLLDTPLSSEQRSYAGTVRSSGEALLAVLEDILDFSKIEAGQLRLDRTEFSVREAVEEIGNLLSLRAREKGVELTIEIDPDVPKLICGDPMRLRQVITNLMSNAVKFTHEGSVAVGVSVLEATPTRATLRFSVEDTGIGIEPHKLELLFEAFAQADASTTRHYGGTGLGLTISRQLVEMMSGSIEVESARGRGSSFSFSVPFDLAEGPGSASDEPLGGPSAAAAGGAPGPLVLVAEDNHVNALVATRMLEKRGLRAEVARDGRAALEMLERTDYAAVFMDCQMPQLDGYEATAEIRRRESGDGRLPVIAMTAHAMTGARETCLAAGMDDYVSKPLRSEALDAIISRWLPA